MKKNKYNGSLKDEYELMKKPVPENDEEKSEMEEIILKNFCSSGSDTDCTGLVPKGRVNNKNENSYRELYPYAIPIENTDNDSHYGKKGTHGGV